MPSSGVQGPGVATASAEKSHRKEGLGKGQLGWVQGPGGGATREQ